VTVRRPHYGGRVELVLEGAHGPELTYRVALVTPSAQWSGRARVAVADGTVSVDVDGPGASPADAAGAAGAPRWLVEFVRQLLRAAWNARRDESAAAPWPERITRWREEKGAPS
jgi:hypothetical protein